MTDAAHCKRRIEGTHNYDRLCRRPLSVEAFIAHVENHPDKRFDIINGEIVDVSPKPHHGQIQATLALLMGLWLRGNPIGVAQTDVLHVLDGRKFIPDMVVSRVRADKHAPTSTQPPLLATEIRSDSQSEQSQRDKTKAYISHGIPAALLILPDDRVELFTADTLDTPVTFRTGETINGIPGFDGLTLDVDELFA